MMNDIDKIKEAVEGLNMGARALGVLNKLYQTHRIEHGEYCTYMDVILGVPSKKRQVSVFDIQKPSALTPEGEAFGKAMAGGVSGPEVAPLQQYGAKPEEASSLEVAPIPHSCVGCEFLTEGFSEKAFSCAKAGMEMVIRNFTRNGCPTPEWCPRLGEKS